MRLKAIPSITKIEPDAATIKLFEMLLERAKTGDIKGGVIVAIDKNGEIDHFTHVNSPDQFMEIIGTLEVAKMALLSKFNYQDN